MRSWHPFGRQRSSDFAEAPTALVIEADPIDYRVRKRPWAAGWTPRLHRSRRLDVLPDETFELVDGDQPLTPRGLDRVDGRHDPSVDRRDADAQSLRRLPTGVREAPYVRGLTKLAGRSQRPRRRRALPPSTLATPSASCVHQRRTLISASDSTCGASVSRLLSR
jgi:hypothetical protein